MGTGFGALDFTGKLWGNQTTFKDIYQNFYNNAYYVALKSTKNENDALNIVQQSFTIAFKYIDSVNNIKEFKNWFNKIVMSSILSYFRTKQKADFINIKENSEVNNEYTDEYDLSNTELFENEILRKKFVNAIDKLPARQRFRVLAYYFQDLDVDEIAMLEGVSNKAVENSLQLAKENLRKGIEN